MITMKENLIMICMKVKDSSILVNQNAKQIVYISAHLKMESVTDMVNIKVSLDILIKASIKMDSKTDTA